MDYARKLSQLGKLKWACRVIVAAATGTSVWANSLTAQKNNASLVIMTLAPLIVMATFELVSRIPIRDGAWILRFTRPTTTAAIMGGAAYLSYWHQRDAFLRYSDDLNTAYILPGLIDGLMVVAAVSLMELNALVEKLEALQAGLKAVVSRREPVQATKVRVLSGKERVAEILASNPSMRIKEIAAKAAVSEGYASTLVASLRKTQDAELVD